MSLWIILAVIAAVFYFLNQHFHSYWSSRGIPYKEPPFILGEIYGVIFGKQSFGEFFYKIYQKHKKNKVVGLYFFYQPALIVADPVLVQDVLIKNFTSFHDRGLPVNEEVDPLSGHLFSISGQKWRNLRVKLSPTFTSGKLKGMFPTIRDCGQVLQDYIDKNVKTGNDVFDIRELLARFTTSVISSVAFGIENDCINEPDNIFRKMGQKFFEPSLSQMFFDILALFMPSLIVRFQIKTTPDDIEEFFMNVIRQTIEYREKNKGFERKDFMQLLIQLKNQGFISAEKSDMLDENGIENDKTIDTKKLTFNELAAQAFVFFIAGFEKPSSTSNFCLYELSKHPKIQKKVQDEIDKVMKASNSSEISYDMLSEMKYLDCCIDETLRKYPILAMLNRECTKKHTFAGTNWTIEKGTMIFIPTLGLHRDPEIYDNPMEFRPERFVVSPTGNGKSNGIYYIPFGDGPRNCIGARMGKLQTKLVLAMTLAKFTFELTDEKLKRNEIEFYPAQFILTPKENIMLKAIPRK